MLTTRRGLFSLFTGAAAVATGAVVAAKDRTSEPVIVPSGDWPVINSVASHTHTLSVSANEFIHRHSMWDDTIGAYRLL